MNGEENWSRTIAEWQRMLHEVARSKGFHDRPTCERLASKGFGGAEPKGVNIDAVLTQLALIHSEVSEAVEAVREGAFILYEDEDGKPQGTVTELADVVIRVMDLCGALGLDLEGAMKAKTIYNRTRGRMHGGKLA